MANKKWIYERTERWLRGLRDGETVVDSKKAMLLIESQGELDYYFPPQDVRQDFLRQSDYAESSGYRGTRRFWHLQVGETLVENAAWTYDYKEGRPDLNSYIAFKWKVMDHWYEEDEEVFLHARNPYHRVDTIASSRHVEVLVDGVKVADTKRPYLLFETSLPTRYYIPEEDVDPAFLQANNGHSICPYKGEASYYDLAVNGELYDYAVWYYPDPIAEAPKLKGKLAFWPEKDKRIQILVDGQAAV